MDGAFHILCHSKLAILGKYVVQSPLLSKTFPETAPSLIYDSNEKFDAVCIDVLPEVWRVSRSLETDRIGTASRLSRLLKEIRETLESISATRVTRAARLKLCVDVRQSSTNDDKRTDQASKCSNIEDDSRRRSGKLWDLMDNRIGHVLRPLSMSKSIIDLWSMSFEDTKKHPKLNQSFLLHFSTLFDIECSFDWIRDQDEQKEYYEIIYAIASSELSQILCDEYDEESDYFATIRSTHAHMCNDLTFIGRQEPDRALIWWSDLDHSSVMDLRKQKFFMASPMVELARAF